LTNEILILVAVRLKSSRLEKKALKDLAGKPLIIRLTERIMKAKLPHKVIWCTSNNPQDNELYDLAIKNNIECYQGSELDVMSRFIEVANKENATTVVRVTGDNPLTDPEMIDLMIDKHNERKADYTFNDDMPHGTRPEIIDVKMLKKCHKELKDPNSSEYMTWMLNRPDYFKTLKVKPNLNEIIRPDLSLTVDTENDYKLMKSIFSEYAGNPPKLEEIIKWIDKNRQLIEYQKVPMNAIKKEEINFRFKHE